MSAVSRERLVQIGIAAAALVALAAAAVALFGDGDPIEPGEARLRVDGEAVVERNGAVERVRGTADLSSGDLVAIVEGEGTIEFSGGLVLEARAGDELADTEVRVGVVPELLGGETLVDTERVAELAAGGVSVTVNPGAARLTNDLGLLAEAYTAALSIETAGVSRELPALRQVSVASAGLPGRITPIDVRNPDRWLQRVLGDAIALGEQLQAQSAGYTAQLRAVGAGRTAGFYRDVVPGLADQQGFSTELIDLGRSPGEIMVGSVLAVLGAGGPFEQRWQQVFDFRGAGAQWGLVALEQGVDRRPLFDQIDLVLAASPSVPFAGDNVASGGPPPPAAPGPGPSTSTTTTTTPGGGTPPTTPPPTSPPPTEPPGPVPIDPTLPPIPPIDEVLDGLGLGG